MTCLNCQRPLKKRGRYCNPLCKSAVDKHMKRLRTAEDARWEAIRSQPTYQLTDLECLAIEARLAGSEILVFDDYHGFSIKDAHKETGSANTNELHDSWADRGAKLDVWAMRKLDRARFGGIVMTPELADEQYFALLNIANYAFMTWAYGYDPSRPSRVFDGLDNPGFHNKLFDFELDELYELETA